QYNLDTQIYVTNGARLTIEAGTIIATTPPLNGGGSLAVTRTGKILGLGASHKPVIFPSPADPGHWARLHPPSLPSGDPKSGMLRHIASEWGNLTVMGNAFISENAIGSNTQDCNAANVANMEGLTDPDPNKVQYGGGNDDDDSGIIKYVSLRYTGRV